MDRGKFQWRHEKGQRGHHGISSFKIASVQLVINGFVRHAFVIPYYKDVAVFQELVDCPSGRSLRLRLPGKGLHLPCHSFKAYLLRLMQYILYVCISQHAQRRAHV